MASKINELLDQQMEILFSGQDKDSKNRVYFEIGAKWAINTVRTFCEAQRLIRNSRTERPSVFFAIRKLNMTTDVETFVMDAIAKCRAYKEWCKNQDD